MSTELQRGSVLGKYELLVRIGRGGMASVWVARGEPIPGAPEQLVAIKAMLPDLAQNVEFRSMFLDEGQIVRSIDHQNVVKVYEVGEAHGSLFLAMEWVEGDSLHALIAEANKRRPIPSEVAVRMIADTASGLHAAHELRGWDGELREIVHCDVSPHNILIAIDGSVKLVDFGVASAMHQFTEDEEAKIRGKFGYMSPEQAQAKPLDRRSDVFSLGIVLFELTTGYRLFRGRDDRHTLDLVTWGKIPRPSQVVPNYPPKLEAIVQKALERDLDRRFQTADELREALLSYLVEERIVVPSAGVKGILRKVLGSRIEQRRQQVRTAIRAIDGSHPGLTLISEESVLSDEDAVSVSVSQVEPPDAVSYSGSLGAARLPTDSSSGAHSVSQPSLAPRPRSSSAFGFAIGASVGIALAAGAFVVLTNQPSEPEVRELGIKDGTQSASSPSAGKAIATATAAEGASAEKFGFSIESLPSESDGKTTTVQVGKPGRAGSPTAESLTREQRIAKDMEALKNTETQGGPERVTLDEDSVGAQPVTLQEEEARPSTGSSSGALDTAAAGAALSNAAGLVGMCRRPGGETGSGKVLVTIAPSGSVTAVNVLPPFAGTAVGACIASHFKRVKVPAFQGAPATLGKTFVIPD